MRNMLWDVVAFCLSILISAACRAVIGDTPRLAEVALTIALFSQWKAMTD